MQTKQQSAKKHESNFLVTLAAALLCAGIIRSFFFEPFHIPSSSMKPNLLIGDYIFVSKFSYGYSRFSFPFGYKFNYFDDRIWASEPQRGDVIVFRFPHDTSVNYVKRLIGLPGDEIQMRSGVLYLNNQRIEKISDGFFSDENGGKKIEIAQFSEKLLDGKIVKTLDQYDDLPQDNTGIYKVPQGYYFFMGDNRDNSQDSRFLDDLGFVPQQNLIGKARIIFFSASQPIWKFWHWHHSLRFKRMFKKID